MIERAGATDRAFLAMDTGPVPEQFAAVLVLDDATGLDLPTVRRLVGDRITAVPRLRQRLVRTPFGCGGPVWVDDPSFDLERHVDGLACPAPGDEPALLELALSRVTTRLPDDASLWSVTLVTGLRDGRAALVLLLHHLLADGLGGLEVLAHLVDEGAGSPAAGPGDFPRPGPTWAELSRDAWRERLCGIRRAASSWRALRRSWAAAGGTRPERLPDGLLLQRTGPARAVALARTDLADLRSAAHVHGATVNDAVLVAIAGALRRVLLTHGEPLDALSVAVPVSGRRKADPRLGNMVSPLLVRVPAAGDPAERLCLVSAAIRAHKAAATGPPPIALLGWLFRPLARVGGYGWYMRRQHRLHTLVSHLRGPDVPVSFAGHRISSAVPIAVAEGGNTPVYFEVLSYAGVLTVSCVGDPEHFPGLDGLAATVVEELDRIRQLPTGDGDPAAQWGDTSPDS